MRYMARRIGTGEWLTRDLALTGVERTVALSGPSTIAGTLEPGFAQALASDGLPYMRERSTMVYAEDERTGEIQAGIYRPPTSYEDVTRILCAGVTSYPKGYIFTGSRLWGPSAAIPARSGTPAQPALPRPDAIEVFRDHWSWLQAQPSSDLGVTLVGDLTTRDEKGEPRVPLGTMAEPYRLRRWDAPDLGSEMENIAQAAPFDFVEQSQWVDDTKQEVMHQVRIGYPRLGRRRDDLRFAVGENVDVEPVVTTLEEAANHLIGLGNGEAGPSMVFAEVPWHDGRLRSTRVYTDKTASQAFMDRRLATLRQVYAHAEYDITSVTVRDHPNARLSNIALGDDIRLRFRHQERGSIDIWVRVLGVSYTEDDTTASLTTSRSDLFIYRPTEEIA